MCAYRYHFIEKVQIFKNVIVRYSLLKDYTISSNILFHKVNLIVRMFLKCNSTFDRCAYNLWKYTYHNIKTCFEKNDLYLVYKYIFPSKRSSCKSIQCVFNNNLIHLISLTLPALIMQFQLRLIASLPHKRLIKLRHI